MQLDREFLEKTIAACKKEQDTLRLNFERQEGVILFCQMILRDYFPGGSVNGTGQEAKKDS